MTLQDLFTSIAGDLYLNHDLRLIIAYAKYADDPEAWMPFETLFLHMMCAAYAQKERDDTEVNLKRLRSLATCEYDSPLPGKHAGKVYLDNEEYVPILTYIIKEAT